MTVWAEQLAFSQNNDTQIYRWYQQGEQFFNAKNPTKLTDNQAKNSFLHIIKSRNISVKNAFYYTQALQYLGIISQLEANQPAAKKYYQIALSTRSKYLLHDTLSFKPLLYLGSIYYNQFAFDSCYFYLNKAESILKKYPKLSENERLYNAFGALYFESGNFRQSIHYFQKSINILKNTNDFSYRNNLATALQFLKKTDSSLVIFNQLAKEFPDEIVVKLNLASAYLDQNKANDALHILEKLSNNQIVGHEITFYNLLGRAYFTKNEYGKAEIFLQKGVALAIKSKTKKNTWLGISYRILGNIAETQNRFSVALERYQKSIVELNYSFNELNFAKNPQIFTEDVHSFNLIKSLTAKALCLKKLYEAGHNNQYFLFAENTFLSLKKLISTVANSYNNEDSRLDFKAEIQPIFSENTELYLNEFKKTQDERFLRNAFETADEGKATILALTMNDETRKQNSDIPEALLIQEKMLLIAQKGVLRQFENKKNNQNKALENKLIDLNIRLSRLKAELEKYPKYKFAKYSLLEKNELASIQKNMNTADIMLYFFEGKAESGIFLLQKNNLKYLSIKNTQEVKKQAKQLKILLKSPEFSQSHVQIKLCKVLYNHLILPFEDDFHKNTNLIIISDGEWNGLPFEVLINGENKYLVEKFPISYLFSAKFLEKNKKLASGKAVAFAPFVAAGQQEFPKLPYSITEVESIKNVTSFLNSQANKATFESQIKNVSLVHLATHAFTDEQYPEKSFIQFYPNSKFSAENKVYLFELSPGLIQKGAFVFLSACESVGSQNIAGEGIRGLSRAFYLAGCKNIISSLWKAEDYTTAYISSHFYKYLETGESYEKALQLAKIDLLNDPKMAQFQDPKYWSHLVFMGNGFVEKAWYQNLYLWIIFGLILVLGVLKKLNFLGPKA